MKQHSQEFIAEMEVLLRQEKAHLEADRAAHADFPDYGRNEEDNATEIADFSATSAAKEEQEARLGEVEAALARIKDGAYGVTKDGQFIPENRLRANPAATTLVS